MLMDLGVDCPWSSIQLIDPDCLLYEDKAGETAILDRAVKLLDSCRQTHVCQTSENIPPLPSRIIDIGHDDTDIRLINGHGLRDQYICLSHCWGSIQPLKTTSENLQDHLLSLPWSNIPKLFQDAIQLARKLNIHYIWIDSLCIVQNDHNDWVRESMNMCQVYENSYLTVCASVSSDCEKGLWDFSSRNAKEIHGISSRGISYSWLAIQGLAEDHPSGVTSHEDTIKLWPLLDRGWVFQERVLSPRVLHFSLGELIWECSVETFCECGLMDTNYVKLNLMHDMESADRKKLAVLWRASVEQYSRLSLTIESDKLPALSGLARKLMQRRTGVQYLAGLWEDSLLEDLLWFSADTFLNNVDIPHLALNRAPSWSWVVMNSRIIFATGPYWSEPTTFSNPTRYMNFSRIYVKNYSAHCELASLDETGEVRSGILTIDGNLFEATLRSRKDDVFVLEVKDSSSAFVADGRSQSGWLLCLDNWRDPLSEGKFPINDNMKVFCLPIARIQMQVRQRLVREVEYSMVLWSIDEKNKRFRRIGITSQVTRYKMGSDSSEYWSEHPSCFEHGGKIETITII
jgi:hypothetical protein